MRKILLADDDLSMVSLLNTLLRMEGYQTVAVDADSDVPAAVRREMPDALLLDVYLGHQSGLEILDSLRNNGDTHLLSIVMTSGMNLQDECMRRGADAFLLKPYMPDELISVLHQKLA